MVVDDPRPLTRKELARILGDDQRAIRAFEKLFDLVPGEFNTQLALIEETLVESGTASAQATDALSRLAALAGQLQALQLAPVPESARPVPDDLTPASVPVPPPRYGQFLRTTDDTLAAANTAEVIDFDTADLSFGVVIDGTNASRIVVDRAGRYQFIATLQLLSTTAAQKQIWVWYRLNGVDVVNSAIQETLGTADDRDSPAVQRVFDLAPGDYVEVAWAADSTDVALDAVAASAFAPAVAACILSVKQLK